MPVAPTATVAVLQMRARRACINDYRLDVSEGFQLFTALQGLKVPSKMLYFPDEGPLGAEAAELAVVVQDGERLGGSVVRKIGFQPVSAGEHPARRSLMRVRLEA